VAASMRAVSLSKRFMAFVVKGRRPFQRPPASRMPRLRAASRWRWRMLL
jgi:hypothetical protein